MSPTANPRRAGQYLRVSLDRDGRARSVDEQQVDNERVAAVEGWPIVASYADPNRSASRYATRARENYLRLLDDISAGRLDILILWEPSRGSRKVSEWLDLIETCEARQVLIHVTSHGRTYEPGNPRDRRSLLEDAVDSDYESGKTSVRVLRSTASSAEAGRPFGSLPFGYLREYEVGSSSPVRQVPDEVLTAPIVREIVARVLAGDGLHKIAVDLNRRGVPTPQEVRDDRLGREGVRRGGWSNPKLRKLLSSPTMAGWRVHQGLIHRQAEWAPLVSAADHAAVQAILGDPSRRTQRGTAPKYLLSGVAECGAVVEGEVCGAWLRFLPNGGYPSYGCAGRSGTNPGHVVRRQAPLDGVVIAHVIGKLVDPALLVDIARRNSESSDAAQSAAAQVAHLRTQISQYEAQASSAGVAAESFGRVITGLYQQLGLAKGELASVGRVPQIVVDAAGPGARKEWNDHNDDIVWQREMVRATVRVVVHKSNQPRGKRGFDRDTIQIIDQ